MVEAVELRSLVIMDLCIGVDGAKESSGQRRINTFEQLEEDQTERVAVGEELISAGIWKLGDKTFGPKLGEVIAEGGERIALGRASECLDDVGMDFGGGKVIAGGHVREPDERMHQGELAGMIEPQSRNASSGRGYGRFSEAS